MAFKYFNRLTFKMTVCGISLGAAILGSTLSSCKSEVKVDTPATSTRSNCAAEPNSDGCSVSDTFMILPKNPAMKAGIPMKFRVEWADKSGDLKKFDEAVTWAVSGQNSTTSYPSEGQTPSEKNENARKASLGRTVTVDNSTSSVTLTAAIKDKKASITAKVALLKSIAVSPSPSSLSMSEVIQFTATATYSDGSSVDVTNYAKWESSDSLVADWRDVAKHPGSLGAVSPGTSTIAATLLNVSGSTSVTVKGDLPTSLTVTSVNSSMHVVMTKQYTLHANYADGTIKDVTNSAAWTSSDDDIAKFLTNSNAGFITAMAPGSVTVSGTFAGLTATTGLNVYPAVLTAINVTPTNPSTNAGGSMQLTATATYADGASANITSSVTWSTSDASKATVNSATGLALGVAVGTVQITATGLTNTGDMSSTSLTTGMTTITVTPATISSINVTAANASLPRGLTEQFTAIATLSDNTTQDVSSLANWTSSDPSKATVSGTGLVTGVVTGSATITATFSGVTSNTSSLTVTAATLSSIALSPTSVSSLPRGLTQVFVATGTYSDGGTADISGLVTWSSSQPTEVNASAGTVTSLANGTSTITATLAGKSATASVTATNPALVSVVVTPENSTIARGLTQQMVATGTYSDGSNANVTLAANWTSNSGHAIASNSAGNEGVASAVTIGSAEITATIGSISDSATVTVGAATLASIAIAPVNPLVAPGLTQQFMATGTYTDGSTSDLTSAVTWTKADGTGSATISSGGLATTTGTGTVTITATSDGVTHNTTMTVGTPTPVDIFVVFDRSTSMKFNIDSTETGMSISDRRFCRIPGETSRWRSITRSLTGFVTSLSTRGISYQMGLISHASDLDTVRTGLCGRSIPLVTNFNLTASANDVNSGFANFDAQILNGNNNSPVDAIQLAISKLALGTVGARKVILLFSDETYDPDISSATASAVASGVTVHSFMMGPANMTVFQQISTSTGGSLTAVSYETDIVNRLNLILTSLFSQ